jgi:hypothetical protein
MMIRHKEISRSPMGVCRMELRDKILEYERPEEYSHVKEETSLGKIRQEIYDNKIERLKGRGS